MNTTKFTNNEILGILGHWSRFNKYVITQMENGICRGTVDWTFRKDNYDERTYELNKSLFDEVFNGNNELTITINWSLEID